MKKLISLLTLVFCLSVSLVFAQSNGVGTNEQFHGPVGLQMYSLRSIAQNDVEAAIKLAADMGFKYVEASSFYDLTAEQYKALLDKYGLIAAGRNYGWNEFTTDEGIQNILNEAKIFGFKYAGIAWYGHSKEGMTEAEALDAAKKFNEAGKKLSEAGLIFVYHNHGYEFRKLENGTDETAFDVLIKNTDPKYVTFEMDTTWVIFPGADPAKYLLKYPGRFALMHLKDLRKGVVGNLSGGTPVENDVTLGTGQANFPEIFKAAQETGVKYYFIEDESPSFEAQIPQSLKYLETVRW
ncbi:MAG: sugar phosphate isomerase/epimerase [Thermoguttaceae bacterium]|nr:sugar phosphate isomerase/epimerase [Thermoguttaceae bacterium]